MNKKRVLFICTRNSARSQMAEAWLKQIGGESFEVESAGLEAGTVKPLVVEAMREVNIDISQKGTQSALDVFKSGRLFHYVIAFFDEASAERCPIFPNARLLYWNIPERSKEIRTKEEQLAQVRIVRDLIQERVNSWLAFPGQIS